MTRAPFKVSFATVARRGPYSVLSKKRLKANPGCIAIASQTRSSIDSLVECSESDRRRRDAGGKMEPLADMVV